MVIPATVGALIVIACVAYVVFRKFTVTSYQIQFAAVQDRVAAIHLDIREDTVRSLRIVYADGRVSEVQRLNELPPLK